MKKSRQSKNFFAGIPCSISALNAHWEIPSFIHHSRSTSKALRAKSRGRFLGTFKLVRNIEMIGPIGCSDTPPTVMPFVDTNILVYSRDSSDPVKQQRAEEVLRVLWRKRTGRLSAQVLQDFYVTVTRKLKPGLPPSEARQDIRDLHSWGPKQLSTRILESAWEIEDSTGLSWWDSPMISSALDCEATILLSEDMQDGLAIRSLEILNPFSQHFDMNRLNIL